MRNPSQTKMCWTPKKRHYIEQNLSGRSHKNVMFSTIEQPQLHNTLAVDMILNFDSQLSLNPEPLPKSTKGILKNCRADRVEKAGSKNNPKVRPFELVTKQVGYYGNYGENVNSGNMGSYSGFGNRTNYGNYGNSSIYGGLSQYGNLSITQFDMLVEQPQQKDPKTLDTIHYLTMEQFYKLPSAQQIRRSSSIYVQNKQNNPRNVSPPPLRRLNSCISPHGKRKVVEFLGDNIYMKQIMNEPNDIQSRIVKYDVDGHGRMTKDYYMLENYGRMNNCEGRVYKVMHKLDRTVYMIKEYFNVPNQKCASFPMYRTQMRLSIRDTDNCMVKFFTSWIQNDNLYVVYEPASYTIDQLNNTGTKMNEREVRQLLGDTCKALIFLKKMYSAHLNIKPTNILNCRGVFKLMDQYSTKRNFPFVNNYMNKYSGPELRYPALVSSDDLWRSDVYALGMVIIENIVGRVDMQLDDSEEKRMIILKKRLRSLDQYSPQLIKLLLCMTNLDARFRPDLNDIMNPGWIVPEARQRQTRRYSL